MDENEDLQGSLERLITLGQTPDINIRPVLLRVVVDLFVRKSHHAPGDLVQFEAITHRLLDDADAETRLTVAGKLARHPAMPPALAQRFLDERGAIAAQVLEHARVETGTLVAAATWGTLEMALAVARRADLDTAACRPLAERPEPDVLHALARNAAAPFDRGLTQYMVRRARDDHDLGRLLLGRGGEPADIAPLFMLAGSEQRAAIVLAARRDDLGPDHWRPRLSAEEVAALSRVERSLLNADHDSFDAALAAALGLDLDTVWQMLDDPRGEPLGLALAAIGASPEFAARVFILSGRAIGHSVMAVRRLTGLVETMPMRAASRLIAAMTHQSVKPRRRKTGFVQDGGRPRGPETEVRARSAEAAAGERRLMGGRAR